jgi:ribosome biogenesis GTPase A
MKIFAVAPHASSTVLVSVLQKMAPKKASSLVQKPLLGRPSNNLKMGIVGMPNVGKSCFFNSLTNSAVPSEVTTL